MVKPKLVQQLKLVKSCTSAVAEQVVKSCTTAEGNGKTQSCTTVVEVGDGKTHFTPFVAISSVQGSFFRVISPEIEG